MGNYQGRRKGTRQIVVWHNGRRNERIFQGSRQEGVEFEARWRLELSGGSAVDPKLVPVFSDFCVARYRPHAEKHLKPRTWTQVRIYQVDTLCKHFGHLRLTEFSSDAVDRYKNDRSTETVYRHGSDHPLMASSINNELRVLRTILNYARDLGYPIPPLKWKKLPTRGNPRAQAWTETQVQTLFRAARERYIDLLPMLVFLLNTGCRKGEAIVAEWTWIDEQAGMLLIPSNDVWQPKNGLPREVPLSDALRATLAGVRRHPKYLFPTRNGDRYATFPKDIFDDIRITAGVTGGPHQFRHTFASHFLKTQPDLFLLARVLGHSHGRITELYSHMLPDHLARARNAVNVAPALETVVRPLRSTS